MTRTATNIRTPFGILVLQTGSQAAASTIGSVTFRAAGEISTNNSLEVEVVAVDTGVTAHVLLFEDGTRRATIGATAGETYAVDLDAIYPDGVPEDFWVLIVPDIDGQRGKGVQVRIATDDLEFALIDEPELLLVTEAVVGEALQYVQGDYTLTPDTVTQTLQQDQGTGTWIDVGLAGDNPTIPDLAGSRLRMEEVAERAGYDTITTYTTATPPIQAITVDPPATLTPAQIQPQASAYVDDPTNLFFKSDFVVTGIPTDADLQWAVTDAPIAEADWNVFVFRGTNAEGNGVWRPEMTDTSLRYPDPLANNTSPRQDFSCHRSGDASRTNVAVRWRPAGTTLYSAASARETVPVPVVAAPTNTVRPTLTGANYKEGVQLTGTAGTWTGNPTFTYNTQRDQADIGGATSLNYTPVQADVGKLLRLKVVATNAGGSTTAFSLETPAIAEDPNIGDPPPGTTFFPVPAVALGDATGKALTRFTTSGGEGTANAGWFGPAMVIEAYAAFAGQTQADSHVAAQFRYNLQGGNCPGGTGGVGLQHQCYFSTAAAIVRRIPRIWDTEFTSSERTKIELLVKAMLVGAAACGSDHAPIKNRSLVNTPDYNTGANVNIRNAKPLAVLAARSFLGGSAAVTSFLDGLNHSSFTTSLQSQGLTNAYNIHNVSGNPWTHAQIETAVQDWTWRNKSISDFQAIALEAHEAMFQHTIVNGLNNGSGILVNGTRRGVVLADPNPNRTEKGKIGMGQEFDSQDAEGKRSSAHYVMWGMRISMQMLMIMMCDGTLDRTSTAIQNLKTRIHNGMLDFRYKSDNGYWNYAHGGDGGGNDQWTESAKSGPYGWSYSFAMWFDIIKPWLDSTVPDDPVDPDLAAHPKTVVTSSELATIDARVNSNTQPQRAAYTNLISVANAGLNYTANPPATFPATGDWQLVLRDYGRSDTTPAYACALAWRLTGDTRYADKSVQIMDTWGRRAPITEPQGRPTPGLHIGSTWIQFMYADDLMRPYGPWQAVRKRFQDWWELRIEPHMRAILTEKMPDRNNPTPSNSNGDNWLDAAISCLMAQGVAFEDTALRDEMIERLGKYFVGRWRIFVGNYGPGGTPVAVLNDDVNRNKDGEILGVQYIGYGGSSIANALNIAANHGANFWNTKTSEGVGAQEVFEQWYRWNYLEEEFVHPRQDLQGAPVKYQKTNHVNILELCNKHLTMSASFRNYVNNNRPFITCDRDRFTTLTAGDL